MIVWFCCAVLPDGCIGLLLPDHIWKCYNADTLSSNENCIHIASHIKRNLFCYSKSNTVVIPLSRADDKTFFTTVNMTYCG